eukprot:scaffold11495_cov88-Skeletonema_dohrnii-CCMP3373.AAC.2
MVIRTQTAVGWRRSSFAFVEGLIPNHVMSRGSENRNTNNHALAVGLLDDVLKHSLLMLIIV